MAGRTIEIRGFIFTEIAGMVYVEGSGIRGKVALGNVDTLNIGMFQGLGVIPAIGASAAEDLASFSAGNVAQILSALKIGAAPPAAETSPTTASQTVQDDSAANPLQVPERQLNAAGRIVTVPETTTPSNVVPPDVGTTDTGTDAPLRTQYETQTINTSGLDVQAEDGSLSSLRRNPETGELYDPGDLPRFQTLPLENVEVAPSDDAANPNVVTNQFNVNNAFNDAEPIKPQPNVLDKFASYVYSASVYLMTPTQYEQLVRSKKKTC